MTTTKLAKFRWTTVGLTLASAAVLAAIAFVLMKTRPVVRNVVETPIFVVGEPKLADALSAHRHVTQMGPMPFGLHDGTRAFRTTREARHYLRDTGRDAQGWYIYELSGDFELDTEQVQGEHRISRTLLVLRRVDGAH